MLVLVRNGNEVVCNGQKLTIVEQATKGPGNEVVKIEGLEGSNGAKWISLKKLQEGKNEINPIAKQVVSTGSYTLNMVEKAEIDKLQARINEIKAAAKARYVPKSVDPSKMSSEELEAYITKLRESLRG